MHSAHSTPRSHTTEQTIYRWESLENAIPDERKLDLARYFGVSLADLMGMARGPPARVAREREANVRPSAQRR
jgi:hypothetical protein